MPLTTMKSARRLLFLAVALAAAIAAVWLFTKRPEPIRTRIPELTALMDQVETQMDQAVKSYAPSADSIAASFCAAIEQCV